MNGYHSPNGTIVEFVKRECYWKDGHLVEGPEEEMTEQDARFMLELIEDEREFEVLRLKVRGTAERLKR